MNVTACKARLREAFRTNPVVFNFLGRRQESGIKLRRVCRKGDDVVIDGFPRSANTYATHAFIMAQPREIKIGNHCHAAAQFFLSKKYGVPAMLVIREPVGAVSSLMVFRGQSDPTEAIAQYIAFHQPLKRIRGSFLVAPFDLVISDLGECVRQLNAKFKTNFSSKMPENEVVFLDIAEHRGRFPLSSEKHHVNRWTVPAAQKAEINLIARKAITSNKFKKKLAAANRLYQEILSF